MKVSLVMLFVYCIGVFEIVKFILKMTYKIWPDWNDPCDAPNELSEDYVPYE